MANRAKEKRRDIAEQFPIPWDMGTVKMSHKTPVHSQAENRMESLPRSDEGLRRETL